MLRVQLPKVPVLVIDDSAPVRSLVRQMLYDVGLRDVTEAADMSEAHKHLQGTAPGLIIVDWYLPEGTCDALVTMIRDPARSRCPTVPVILLTAQPTFGVVDRAQDLGLTSLLRKPFSPKMLWQRIARALQVEEDGLGEGHDFNAVRMRQR